jgi:hypothetical protein
LVAQLKDVVQALGSKQQGQQPRAAVTDPGPWAFAYHSSRGVRAEGIRALLRLLRQQRSESAPSSVLKATMSCLVALLERDRAHQYLAVRAFEEMVEEGEASESLQGFFLHAYAACWGPAQRGKEEGQGHGETKQSSFLSSSSSSSAFGITDRGQQQHEKTQALFLRLWALLAASQLLALPAGDLPLLARILLAPIYRATASAPPLSPPRRRRGKEQEHEGGDGKRCHPHPLLLPSLELLAQVARASPAFRLCLRAENHRERNM